MRAIVGLHSKESPFANFLLRNEPEQDLLVCELCLLRYFSFPTFALRGT
jgi:hypothetical protein